jgi:hypothetical protein
LAAAGWVVGYIETIGLADSSGEITGAVLVMQDHGS